MSNHSLLVTTDIHSPFRWIFADSTARLAQVVSVDDITKIALQESDNSIWVLTAVTTWVQIGGTTVNLIEAGVGANSIILNGVGNSAGGNRGISGGYNNSASGDESVTMGGVGNVSPGDESGVFAGTYGTANGNGAIVLGGDSSYANGNRSVALGGFGNVADGDDSIAGGYYGKARLKGQFTVSSGMFSTAGDSQVSIYNLRRSVTHSDAAWYSLYMDGSADLLLIPTNTLFTFIILLSGISSTGTKALSYKIEGAIKNAAGTTTLLASTVTVIHEDDVDFNAQVLADDTNDALLIQVQDSTSGSDLIYWSATTMVSEVAQA